MPIDLLLVWCKTIKLAPHPDWFEIREPEAPAKNFANAVSPSGRKERKRDKAKDAINKARYARVKTMLDRLAREHPKSSKSAIRALAIESKLNETFSDEVLKEIELGKYGPMNKLNQLDP